MFHIGRARFLQLTVHSRVANRPFPIANGVVLATALVIKERKIFGGRPRWFSAPPFRHTPNGGRRGNTDTERLCKRLRWRALLL